MSWLRERVESKAGRTVPLPPRNEPWLPSVLAHVNPAVVSALTYAVIDERDQPDGRLSVVLSGWPRLDALGPGADSRHTCSRCRTTCRSTASAWQPRGAGSRRH